MSVNGRSSVPVTGDTPVYIREGDVVVILSVYDTGRRPREEDVRCKSEGGRVRRLISRVEDTEFTVGSEKDATSWSRF